jgi:4-amino-4-deoxy-L-arabinose transferase-like glycosyltransferase
MASIVAIPIITLLAIHDFNGLYGQDPYAYLDYALGPARDAILGLQSFPPFFWPPGFPILVALASILTGKVPLAGQLVSLAAGMLIPGFTFLLAKELWPFTKYRLVGPSVAGLISACTGQLWQSSAVIMADTTGLAAATLGSYALVRFAKKPESRSRWLLLAAGSFAYAILARWAFALPAIPASLYAVVILARSPKRSALNQASLSLIIALFILSPVIESIITEHVIASGGNAGFMGDLEVYRWTLATVFKTSHVTSDGLLTYQLPNGLYYALLPAHWYYLTPVAAVLVIPGISRALREFTMPGRALLLGWPLIMYLFHAGTPWQNFRFPLAFLPPLAILAAIGFFEVIAHFGRNQQRFAGLILSAALVLMAAGGWRLTSDHILRNARDLETAAWVESVVPDGSLLIVFGITATISHNTSLETIELFHLDELSLEELINSDCSTYILIDLVNVEQQWSAMPPAKMYQKLVSGPGLIHIDEFNGYSLLQVRGGGDKL